MDLRSETKDCFSGWPCKTW